MRICLWLHLSICTYHTCCGLTTLCHVYFKFAGLNVYGYHRSTAISEGVTLTTSLKCLTWHTVQLHMHMNIAHCSVVAVLDHLHII